MAAFIFDTGALIAIERGDRGIGALLSQLANDDIDAITSSACVAEAWRDPARQARLTRALSCMIEFPLDDIAARRVGLLLAKSRSHQIADGAVALLASDDDVVITSDPDDIRSLLTEIPSSARLLGI